MRKMLAVPSYQAPRVLGTLFRLMIGLGSIPFFTSSSPSWADSGILNIVAQQGEVLIDKGGVTLADVRDADAYRASRIENAIHVQHETIDEFLAIAEKSKPLIIYCYHGNSSQGAANYFDGLGFSEVYSVDGGFEAWRSKY